jgi:hypothetical protein
MGSSDGTRDVSATAPATPLEGLAKTSGRSRDGGGYGAQVNRLVEQGGIGWGQAAHGDPIAELAPGGAGEDFWGQSIHCAG